MKTVARYIPAILVSIGFLVVIVAGTYRLSESPAIWFDEGMYTQTALSLERHGTKALQVAPDTFITASSVTGGFSFIAPIALSYKIFGEGVLQGRAVMALFILAFALVSFFFVSTLFGIWQGSWTLLLLSSFSMLYGNGKSVLGEVPGLFFMFAALLALLWLERKSYQNTHVAILFGFFTGLCVVTKPTFLVLLPVFALVWLLRWKAVRIKIHTFALSALVFLVPVGIWLYFQLGMGDTIGTLLSFYTNPYNATDVSPLILTNISRFFTDTTALYTFIVVGVWSLALILQKLKKETVSIAELAAFFFSLSILGASLSLPGWNRYLFPATTVALLFFPHSSLYIFRWIHSKLLFLTPFSFAPYALFVLLFVGQSYQLAFSSYVASYYGGHRSAEVGKTLDALGTEASIFVYNVPEVVLLLPSENYYQYIRPHEVEDEESAGIDQLPRLAEGVPDYVIIGTSDYTPSNPHFSAYQLRETVNRYSILEKI